LHINMQAPQQSELEAMQFSSHAERQDQN